MRLRRLALTDVAGVDASELVVPEQGVSVVLAPNEAGKSTLLRAYRLLLSKTGHTGKSNDVKSLQPVGRDVGSTIEAELVIGEETFEVSRTYNRQVSSSLTVRGRGTVIKTGKEADDLLRSRFLGSVDQDLFELLMFEQGRVLDALSGAASTTVMVALNERDAGATTAAATDGVIEALRARVGKAFHARNDTIIGALRKKEQEVEEAEQRRDELAQRIAAISDGAGDAGHATQIAALREELADITRRIERAGAAEKAVTARKLLEATTNRARQRSLQVAQVDQLLAEEKQVSDQITAAKKDLATIAARITGLEEAEKSAAKERETLVAGAAQAEANLLSGLERTTKDLTAALKKEKVDEKLVKSARKLDREVAVAQGSLESGSWELTAKAGRPLALEIDGEPQELKKGAKLTRAVSASLVLRDPDGTILDLHADADRRKAVGRLAEASTALAELLKRVGAVALEDLEERLSAREETEARIEELGRYVEEIREEPVVEKLPAPDHKAEAEGGPDGGPDLDALEAAHVEAIDRLEDAGEANNRELDDARSAHEQRIQVIAQQEKEHARSTERRTVAEDSLAAARKELSDAALGEEVAKAAAALEALGDVGEVEEVEDVAPLEQLMERCRADLEELQRQAILAEGRRSSAGALAATLNNLAENAEALRSQFERDIREAEAARELLGRLEDARAAQGDRYRVPLEARIGELLTELYRYDCSVELDDDLRIVQRSEPDGRMVPWSQLSGGAKEQAAVVTGLAIAELAGDGGVPFWIDDAIVYTDDDRVEGLKSLLAATTAQVIVLTCRSELATGLPSASFKNGRD